MERVMAGGMATAVVARAGSSLKAARKARYAAQPKAGVVVAGVAPRRGRAASRARGLAARFSLQSRTADVRPRRAVRVAASLGGGDPSER